MTPFFENLKKSYIQGNGVLRLIYIISAVSLVVLLFQSFVPSLYVKMMPWIALSSNFENSLIRFWTFISYSFIHASFLHLLFNMLMFFFISQLFKTFFTEIQLLAVYIFGSIFAGLVYILTAFLFHWQGYVVGASAAIMALLFAVTTYAPNMSVRLMLIGQVKVWHLAALVVVLDVLQLPASNAGGHIAHLGGALFGFLYIQLLNKGYDMSRIIPKLQNVFNRKTKTKTPFQNVYTHHKTTNTKYNPYQTTSEKEATQQQIDQILDKIKKSGYESLSTSEKEFLFKQK